MKKIFDFLYGNKRWGQIILFPLMSICTTALLAIVLSAAGIHNFFLAFQWVFYLIGAAPVVSAILLLLKLCPAELAYGFGCGLYYGTLGTATLINHLWQTIPYSALIAISFTITVLACYIIYLEKFKK